MTVVAFPSPDVIEAALTEHPSIAAAARSLGLKERTLQERVQRGQYSAPVQVEPSVRAEIPVFHLDYSDLDHLYVYPLGDVHIGSPACDRERWLEWLAYLEANENTSLLGTGDFLNAGIIGSKSDTYGETMTAGAAKRVLSDDLAVLAEDGRLDLLMPGNHEDRIWRAVGMCPIEDLADQLNVNYTRNAALLVYTVGEVEYEVYVRHGTGNGQHLAQLAKSANVAQADVYVTGHTHRQAATADEFFRRDGDRVVRERRYYVSSGSFLAYEGYAAARGYTPTRLGAPRLYLNGARKDVHVSI